MKVEKKLKQKPKPNMSFVSKSALIAFIKTKSYLSPQMASMFIRIVEEIPTDFDYDSVMEQFKDWQDFWDGKMQEEINSAEEHMTSMYSTYLDRFVDYGNAIDILEKRGITTDDE